ncbi:MAG: recombinase family protein [Clostridiales bacterium]|nr:recombinase family protein [Clostridiales bacterium]
MKAVYYGLAAGEEERKNKREELKRNYQNDAGFYASYVDIADQYNKSVSQRPGYQSMLRAIRKNKIDMIYVTKLEDLNMSENAAMNHMLDWKEKGVSVMVGDSFSTGEMSRGEIIDELSDIYLDRIFADYQADIITFSTVYISHPNWKTPFVYIEGKCKEDVNLDVLEKSSFYDIANKYRDGFFVYQPKLGGWDFVDPDAEVFLMNEFSFYYSVAVGDL